MKLPELYDWQTQVINNYSNKGTIKAITGAGKTLPALRIAEKIGRDARILIASHRASILDQWKVVMKDFTNIQFLTFNVLCKNQYKDIDLLIVDENHRSTSPEFIKMYDNVDYKNILGLSATPTKEAIKKCGKELCDIKYDEANISPFLVTFHGIELTYKERMEYQNLSYRISQYIQEDEKYKKQQILDALIMKRRDVVYRADKRVPYALDLIYKNYGHKILVICQRIDQAEKISKDLKNLLIAHVVYHSKRQDDLELYRKGEVKICISVGMLKEGFNDPETDVGIIVSTTLSESFNIQAIGRIIRHVPNKFANVHIILANKTSDEKVLGYSGNYDFVLKNIKLPQKQTLKDGFFKLPRKVYGFSQGQLWKRSTNGRVYFKDHFILKELEKVKPSGGRFIINSTGVYTKVEDVIYKVFDKEVTLEEEEILPKKDLWMIFNEGKN